MSTTETIIHPVMFPDLVIDRSINAGKEYMRALAVAHKNGMEQDYRPSEAICWVRARTNATFEECENAYRQQIEEV